MWTLADNIRASGFFSAEVAGMVATRALLAIRKVAARMVVDGRFGQGAHSERRPPRRGSSKWLFVRELYLCGNGWCNWH